MLNIITADGHAEEEFITRLRARGEETGRSVTASVTKIIENVAKKGDSALRSYTRRFDGAAPRSLEVSQALLKKAASAVEPEFMAVLERAASNIRTFHEKQKREGFLTGSGGDILMGQQVRPLARVGVYVPGGTASYPSSVLMNVIPAKVAGVQEIIMCTPPGKDGQISPRILAAAAVAGVNRIFKCGGAQAIAAMAYGTATVPKVDKIVGPGNIFVATAKRLVFGTVDIDMIAGPSEILIVADKGADPVYIAADMMSQAEHDVLASAILICTEPAVAEAVQGELIRQMASLSRRDIIEKSLSEYGGIIIAPDLDSALDIANSLAPEHLELMVQNPVPILTKVRNAGSVFLGYNTPEPLGDYMAGPNHVLPTSGTARFFSPLSVDSFIKKMSYLYYGPEALQNIGADVIRFAEAEGLTAHANSVKVRMKR